MRTEHPIGKVIDLPDGREVKAVKAEKQFQCNECALKKYPIYDCPICSASHRIDRKNIIYKETKKK